MKFLKSLTLSLLGFLLFFSLAIFGLVYMLNNTLLKPDFVADELNRLDISSLAGEIFNFETPPEASYMNEVIDETIAELEPWMKEQLNTVVYSFYDYLLEKTPSLKVIISTEQLRDTLRESLWEAFSASPPPELEGFPPAVKEQYFNQFYQQLTESIPSTFELTEGSLPPDALAMVEQVKQAIGYFQLVYWALIGFMALLVAGIILISRQVKDITRRLGVPCLTYGAVEYAGVLVARHFAEKPLPLPEIPLSLQTWMSQFLYNVVAPLEMFSLGLLIGGIVLVVVSFVYKPRQSSS